MNTFLRINQTKTITGSEQLTFVLVLQKHLCFMPFVNLLLSSASQPLYAYIYVFIIFSTTHRDGRTCLSNHKTCKWHIDKFVTQSLLYSQVLEGTIKSAKPFCNHESTTAVWHIDSTTLLTYAKQYSFALTVSLWNMMLDQRLDISPDVIYVFIFAA